MYRHLIAIAVFSTGLNLIISTSGLAATLTKVKGDQVLIDLQGEASQYAEGGRYLVMVDGKKKAVVEVTKIKAQKALGKVLKGTASENGTLAPLPAASSANAKASAPTKQASSRSHGGRRRHHVGTFSALSVGALASYGLASQSVTEQFSGIKDAMTGSSYGAKAFADLPVSGNFGLIGRFGFENFSVAGSSPTLGSIQTSILYIDADLLARYQFLTGNFHPFPLAGIGIHYPLSKSSGVLDVQRISATTIFFLGGGFNYSINPSMYIHATGEYGLFPPSNDVTTSLIAFRVGVGWAL